MQPNTTVWWADLAAISTAQNAALKVADFTTGLAASASPRIVNISAAIATGYSLNAGASTTTKSKSIVDAGNAESRGAYTYVAELPLFREALPLTNTTSDYLVAFMLFLHKGASGYLIKRLGKLNTAPLVVGDPVSVFLVKSDNPQDVEGDIGAPISMTVPFLQQGYMMLNTAMVA